MAIAPSEKHLEDWLFDDITRLGSFTSPTVFQNGVVYRQLEMRRGIADLLFIGEKSMTVVELKKGEIDDHALQQILRYIGDLKDTWNESVHTIPSPNQSKLNGYPYYGGLNITGILIGYSSNQKTLSAAWGADIWTAKYEYDEDFGYELDWLFHDDKPNENNPLEYSDISDAMVRMARDYIKENLLEEK